MRFRVVLGLILWACGGSNDDPDGGLDASSDRDVAVDGPADVRIDVPLDVPADGFVPTPPDLQLVYPAATAWSLDNSLHVSGTTRDESNVVSVVVSVAATEVEATTADDFATWNASADLALGWNDVVVRAEDDEGTSAEVTVRVLHEPHFGQPYGAAFDSVGSVAYFVDRTTQHIVGVDVETLDVVRNVSLEPIRPADGGSPAVDLAYDPALDRAYVLKRDDGPTRNRGVHAYDFATETWSVISDNTIDSSGVDFGLPGRIALKPGEAVFVHDVSLNGILRVDLDTGIRTVLSSNSVPDASPPLFDVTTDIDFDAVNDRLVALDRGSSSIFGVDVTSGARTLLTGPGIAGAAPFATVNALGVHPDGTLAYVFDRAGSRVFQVSLETGSGRILSDSGEGLVDARSLLVDAARGRVLAFDGTNGDMIGIDTASGARTLLRDQRFPRLRATAGFLAAIPHRNQLLFAGVGGVERVNAELDRTVLLSTFEGEPLRINAMASAASEIYVTLPADLMRSRFGRLDPDAAVIEIVSGPGVPDDTNPLDQIERFMIDSTARQAYIRNRESISAIDLDTGARSVVSDATTPDATLPLSNIVDLALDAERNRLILASQTYVGHALAVDLDSGARSEFSNPSAAGPAFASVVSGCAMTSDGRLYLVDGFTTIYQVDPATEARTRVELPSVMRTISHLDAYEMTVLATNESGQLLQYHPESNDAVLLHD